jgi:RNA polymerase I-specific transcription initiation factor RRN3
LDEDEYAAVVHHCFDPDAADDDHAHSPHKLSQAGTHPSEKGHANVLSFEDLGDISDLDSDDDDDDDSDDDVSEADSDAPPPMIVSDFMEMSGKLDSILNLLMIEIRDLSTDSSISPEEKLEFFSSVFLRIFERTILPTHKSRYTQFLWFYACSLDRGCTEAFLVLLAQKIFDTSCPSIIRVSASAYLASFVARAGFLDSESVLYCIRMLNGWALSYVEQYEADVKQPDVQRYAVFYSVVQALLYVFCFRWRQIVAAADSRVAYGQLPVEMTGFPKIVMSKFAPLRVCVTPYCLSDESLLHLKYIYIYILTCNGLL